MRINFNQIAATGALSLVIWGTGCGMPGPPQPPSLKLPKLVEDLDAQRSGGRVILHWTGPSENTDKTKVQVEAIAVVCRKNSPQAACDKVGSLPNRPGEAMEFADALPADLQTGEPRLIAYEVAIENRRQRTAGWSIDARAAAGQAAPDAVNLVAANTARGVQLTWQLAGPGAPGELTYRIFRTRLTDTHPAGTKATGASAQKSSPKKSGLASAEEPADQTLEVAADTNTTLDTHTAWQRQYSYRVQAVKKVRLETDHGLVRFELPGLISNTITVETKDVFPPAAPRGLSVVPVWGDDDKPGMDLSWQPNTEARLAGYRVYRKVDAGAGVVGEELISGPDLLTAPVFADRGLTPGTKYRYWVIAVDAGGNASPKSASDSEVALRSRE
jgi:hypothetical protein